MNDTWNNFFFRFFFARLVLHATCARLKNAKKDDSLCKLQVDQNTPTLNYEKNEGINKM